jgi:hypothetical protein
MDESEARKGRTEFFDFLDSQIRPPAQDYKPGFNRGNLSIRHGHLSARAFNRTCAFGRTWLNQS